MQLIPLTSLLPIQTHSNVWMNSNPRWIGRHFNLLKYQTKSLLLPSRSDDNQPGGSNLTAQPVEGKEVWPPRVFDPLAPLHLPIGPSTQHMRSLLTAEVSHLYLTELRLLNIENDCLTLADSSKSERQRSDGA